MICPQCAKKTEVSRTTPVNNPAEPTVVRERKCIVCLHSFQTNEQILPGPDLCNTPIPESSCEAGTSA